MSKILVIDDDDGLRDTIALMLERENFTPIMAADGRSGYEKALSENPSLVLVDLRLPQMTGVEVCRTLRAAQIRIPIIVLSAVSDEMDKVLLLEIGADDYIVKPFGARELLARIRAVMRRASPDRPSLIKFGEVEVDLERHIVTVGTKEIRFTPAEYNLLAFFIQNPDRVLSRDVILNSVWGYESYPNTRTVDAHVVRLRQKLEPEPSSPRYFLTAHGFGYRFIPQ
jgi:DNA-binding response OmpR family regulator